MFKKLLDRLPKPPEGQPIAPLLTAGLLFLSVLARLAGVDGDICDLFSAFAVLLGAIADYLINK